MVTSELLLPAHTAVRLLKDPSCLQTQNPHVVSLLKSLNLDMQMQDTRTDGKQAV